MWRPDALAEAPLQRGALLHDDRAALADRGQRRGDLAADVGAADQHDVLRVGHPLADRVGVAERAQVVDLLERHTRARSIGARSRRWRSASGSNATSLLGRQFGRACVQIEPRDALVRVSCSSMSCSTHHSFDRTAAPRESPRRADTPSSNPGGCTAGPARAPPAAPSPRPPPRAASARSSRSPSRRRSADSRPRGSPCWAHYNPGGWRTDQCAQVGM